MKDYLNEASLKGRLRDGLDKKSYTLIRESQEFVKAYDAKAKELSAQEISPQSLKDELSKFAAEWIYPTKKP